MIQIKLGHTQPVPADSLNRTTIGWAPGMSEADAWLAGRGVWKMKADRVLSEEEIQIISPDGEIVAVATITGLTKHGDRLAVEGNLLAGDPRVGTQSPFPHPSRNPVAYV